MVLSGYFSSTETSLTAITELKAKKLIEDEPRLAKYFILWIEHPQKVLTAILIGNNVVNIFASVLAAELARTVFGSVSIALVTAVMTILILMLGEVIPKTLAKRHYIGVAKFLIRPLYYYYIVIYPVSWILSLITDLILKIGGGGRSESSEEPKITSDEIEFIVSAGKDEGVIKHEQHTLIKNIFGMKDITAKEIMIPRNKLAMIDKADEFEKTIAMLEETRFSRYPVYEDKVDNIIGMFYTKNLLSHINKPVTKDILLGELSDVYYVPESKSIEELLRDMQRRRKHIAVVIDEYGGISGVVTLEDILEEIVGEILDEYDEVSYDVVQIDEYKYIVDGSMNIHNFLRKYELDYINQKLKDKDVDYDTVGGFVYDVAGEIPSLGNVYSFYNITITVRAMDERQVKRVEIVIDPDFDFDAIEE